MGHRQQEGGICQVMAEQSPQVIYHLIRKLSPRVGKALSPVLRLSKTRMLEPRTMHSQALKEATSELQEMKAGLSSVT